MRFLVVRYLISSVLGFKTGFLSDRTAFWVCSGYVLGYVGRSLLAMKSKFSGLS